MFYLTRLFDNLAHNDNALRACGDVERKLLSLETYYCLKNMFDFTNAFIDDIPRLGMFVVVREFIPILQSKPANSEVLELYAHIKPIQTLLLFLSLQLMCADGSPLLTAENAPLPGFASGIAIPDPAPGLKPSAAQEPAGGREISAPAWALYASQTR